jgi:O-antigen ligase
VAILAPPSSERIATGTVIGADTLLRTCLFIGVLLAVWITFHPFPDLSQPAAAPSTAADDLHRNAFAALFLLLAAWTCFHEPERLTALLRPALIAALAWCALSVLMSWEPSLSARRFAFTLLTVGVAAMLLLLPKNIRHFSDMIAAAALIVLALCYLGIVLAPSLSIHQLTDFKEPQLAGDWRGVFDQKNHAGEVMVLFVFVGLFVARMRSAVLGGLIVVLAATFLYFTHSKTSLILLPFVWLLSVMMAHMRRPAAGVALGLVMVVVLNVLSVGSVYFKSIADLTASFMWDPSFTGRTSIWKFALQHVAEHPWAGFGFAAFWGTDQVVYGMSEGVKWAYATSDAHNGYLELALTTGIPGSLLVSLWLVVLPLVDFYRCPRHPDTAPLQLLFLRSCLITAYTSCFESALLGLFAIAATFGLRLLSVSRLRA